jgi:hypothetical protein
LTLLKHDLPVCFLTSHGCSSNILKSRPRVGPSFTQTGWCFQASSPFGDDALVYVHRSYMI